MKIIAWKIFFLFLGKQLEIEIVLQIDSYLILFPLSQVSFIDLEWNGSCLILIFDCVINFMIYN